MYGALRLTNRDVHRVTADDFTGGESNMRVKGKVAFITGAGRGQGRSHAIHLAREGADLILCDVAGAIPGNLIDPADPDDLQQTIAAVKQERSDTRMIARHADVRDPGALQELVNEGVAELGKLDVVVANAGIFNYSLFLDHTPEMFTQVVDVNLSGVFNTCWATVPHMIKAGNGGSVILISSTAGIKGQPFTPGYTAAKHGVVGLMKGLANELGEYNIRVNTIHPAGVQTKMGEAPGLTDIIASKAETMGPLFMNSLPVEMMEPKDTSYAVVFLASDESRYVTGLQLKVDAGTSVR